MRQLFTHAQPYDYTHLAMKLIRQSKGMVHYQELTKQIPLSVRQLQREFKAAYSLTMTDYMRLMRMNTIHNYMLSENISLTQLSYELNFTDQSHFIREFKKYAGIAPKKFIKDKDDFLVSPAIL